MGNVYAFGPKDEALNRQEIVDTLKQLIEGNDNLKAFPANFKLALEMRVWESERKFAGMTEIPPCSLHDFIYQKYPYGIGATYEIVENLIRDRADVLALWVEVTKRPAGRPKTNPEILDNVQDKPEAPTGNTAAAGLRKLQKAAAEGNEKAETALAEVKEGKKSVHAACVESGLRKATKIDADVKQRAARAVAEYIAEHADGNDLDALKANLFAAGAKNIGTELVNLLGESIMDRRYS